MKHYLPIRYRSNNLPRVMGIIPDGRQTWDSISGFYCFEGDLAADEYGNMVDQRRGNTYIYNHRLDGGPI
jgi:hypothetical protein